MRRPVSTAAAVEAPQSSETAAAPDRDEAGEGEAGAITMDAITPEGTDAGIELEATTAITEIEEAAPVHEPEEAAPVHEPEEPAEEREPEAEKPEAALEPEGPEAAQEPEEPADEKEPGAEKPDAALEPEEPAAEEIGADRPTAEEAEPPGAVTESGELDAGEEAASLAFISPPAPEAAIRASSMDSLTLPERSRHEADARRLRRRRSAARLPVLVAPVDIPEDAEGRVEILVVRGEADRDEPAPPRSAIAEPRDDLVRHLLTLGAGWVAVAVLAAGLVVVFVALSLVYR